MSYIDEEVEEEKKAHPFDPAFFCLEYEAGDLPPEIIIEGFQTLIDTGIVWSLQGNYGSQAQRLIDAGICKAANAVAA